MSGLYIHIPFCKQACSYCDFYFVTRTSGREAYVKRLLQEIESYRSTFFTEGKVKTIYFGGGTPSLLEPVQVEQILGKIYNVFDVDAEEVSLEMNPDDVTREYLSSLKMAGIHRASMGVQTFQPELLKFMNRAHDREEAVRCLELLSDSGFDSFTVDLIYGNPGQTMNQLREDIETLLKYDPPHISAYSLTIESGTRLGKQVELGRIIPPADDRVADHFDLINDMLSEHNIRRYEVSNYSKPGKEAIHNSSYWKHENYLGFGPGAHSFWWNQDARRWENEADLQSYLEQDDSSAGAEELTFEQLAEERIMMGLRTRWGVLISELKNKYHYELNDRQIQYLKKREQEDKLILDDSIVLTDKGVKIADAIILDLITLH